MTEVGAGALAIDAVARGAGLSRPSLYFYFGSKAELIAALVARSQLAVFTPLSAAVESEHTPLRTLVRPALEHAVQRWREHGAVLRAGIELSASMPEVGVQYDAAVARLIDTVSALVVRDMERGLADPDESAEIQETVGALVLMSERSLHRLFATPHGRDAERRLVGVLESLWVRGLGLRSAD